MKHKVLSEDWEFNILGVYNYRQPGRLKYYFDYVIDSHKYVAGDILEAGVFRGSSLLGMGLLLKELGSKKVVYGYDTWTGFPPIYHKMDDQKQWDRLYREGKITDLHKQKILKNKRHRSFSLGISQKDLSVKNVSLSGEFTSCSRDELQAKIDYLGLDNVKLVTGPFSETMKLTKAPFKKLMAAIIDADLYMSYKVSLPFIWHYLSRGGYVWLDEYYSFKFPGGRIATDEFFADKKDKPQMHKIIEGDFERWYVRRLYD